MASARNLHDELRLSLNDVLLAEKIEATRLLAQLGIEVIVIGLSIGKMDRNRQWAKVAEERRNSDCSMLRCRNQPLLPLRETKREIGPSGMTSNVGPLWTP